MEWFPEQTIGRGSFSTVSLATTMEGTDQLPPLIAVKTSTSLGTASLLNEKQVLDQLGSCPEIVKCFGFDRSVRNGEQLCHLLLEYAPRGSLAKLLNDSGAGRLPEKDVSRYTKSVLKALGYTHARGFAHCDLKLENILLFQNGGVKIADFGLAKKTEREQSKTSQFEIRGTPLHMAPESVNNAEFESPADIWALGCCVAEMVSGRKAWSDNQGLSFLSLLMHIGTGNECPTIPEELSAQGKDFLAKCFIRDQKKRWTAEMLLNHPFVAVDDEDNGEAEARNTEKARRRSPRSPFDFPDWIPSPSHPTSSTTSVGTVTSWFNSPGPEPRIKGLATEERPDWSVTSSWLTVRI